MRTDRAAWSARLPLLLAVPAAAWGLARAFERAWVCDDAFISFRYAHNLVHGLGLVYNPGERVEGFTNLLWTLWTALGMRLGFQPEPWSIAWGLAFYAGTILLLGLHARRLRDTPGAGRWVIPLAALLAALHTDWNVYATAGLETSLFTFLAVLGFLGVTAPRASARGLAAAGAVFALASLTRPDGLLFAGLAGLYVIVTGRPRVRAGLSFGLAFLALWLPATVWRVSYYGDFLPNTYYAKSAYLAWYSQGWEYLRLYFRQYWVLLAGLVLAPAALLARRRGGGAAPPAPSGAEAALAAAFALAYSFYVLRVGGDFMYARLLIPTAPFFLILLEWSVARLARGSWAAQGVGTAAAVLAMALAPVSLPGVGWESGIVNEWRIYSPREHAQTVHEGRILRRFFEGVPVRIAFVGSQAGLMYYANPRVAIESETGLTDKFIAHQRLTRRGRVGHEKHAPLGYLIEQRKVDFVIHHFASETLDLDAVLPDVAVGFDSIWARMVHWDPEIVAQLRARGADILDFPGLLDQYAREMPDRSDAQVRVDYLRAKRFYFEHVRDPARERPFLERLGLSPAPRAGPGR